MSESAFLTLATQISRLQAHKVMGRVAGLTGGLVEVEGLSRIAGLHDRVALHLSGRAPVMAEVIQLGAERLSVLPESAVDGIKLGDVVEFSGDGDLRPCPEWLGRVIDPFGAPLDGKSMETGLTPVPARRAPPQAFQRKALGQRIVTGVSALDTFLPLVRGQRLGLFAGSGVGKSTLMGAITKRVQADVVVVALIGERGREVGEFVHKVLGPEGMRKAVIVAATSDQSPLIKRRAAWTAMSVAEHFRDMGAQVLMVADSITRFAEAHRDIAIASGEKLGRGGFPASTNQLVMELAERAGTGPEGVGDISAIFSVLVAGSDMEEPIADLVRGVLDGHVVLDRAIAERGRFPAIDVLASVSRSLPDAASEAENGLLTLGRAILAKCKEAELLVQSGLYTSGTDPELDAALAHFGSLDRFLGTLSNTDHAGSFDKLAEALGAAEMAPV